MPLADIRLPGAHNVSNVLAATAVGLLSGVPAVRIRQAVRAFAGLEGRLETVLRLDGVRFVNDTKATQQDATIAALHSIEPPIVLIAGGLDKRLPLDGLARHVAERAAAVVLIDETGPLMARLFRGAGAAVVEQSGSMEAAVSLAHALARDMLAATGAREATVLLSPAAAGIETFSNRSVRGDAFRHAVENLAARRVASGERWS
jgi:UDP-N-acetylmuramoylalanine--D-glutamate ligase